MTENILCCKNDIDKDNNYLIESKNETNEKKEVKIAFLFLIYQTIELEELWMKFFENVDKNKYNIYIHYKYNKQLKYFNDYKITNCTPTKWGHISLVNAQNLLLLQALKDINNRHFIFLSDTCLPFKNFDYIYNFLDSSKSYFNILKRRECFPRCNKILEEVDKKYIYKASQWCILNRKHAELMSSCDFNPIYEKLFAPDEHCYIITIFQHNLENEIIITQEATNNATTFINRYEMKYKYRGKKAGIKEYTSITEEEIEYLLKSRCLFGRKFKKSCISNFLNSKEYQIEILDIKIAQI